MNLGQISFLFSAILKKKMVNFLEFFWNFFCPIFVSKMLGNIFGQFLAKILYPIFLGTPFIMLVKFGFLHYGQIQSPSMGFGLV